jgi:hypothetical protein
MKQKQILLLTTFTLLLQGCGSNSNNFELDEEKKWEIEARHYAEKYVNVPLWDVTNGVAIENTPAEKEKNRRKFIEEYIVQKREIARQEKEIASSPRFSYIFNNTLRVNLPSPRILGICGDGSSYKGIVSNDFKHTIRNIWKSLSEKGFSGFDDTILNDDNKFVFSLSKAGGTPYDTSLELPEGQHRNFAYKYVQPFVVEPRYPWSYGDYLKELKDVSILLGLKYHNKALTLVRTADGKYEAVLADEFRQDPTGKNSDRYIPPKIDSDIPVTQAQIEEWNQVFIDALKEDPFFGKQMSVPADTSGNASALNALKGKVGVDAIALRVDGVLGSQMDLGLPVYVQLKGDVDHSKTTDGITGLVAYRFGNTAVGAIQSYSNESETSHTETSLVAAQALGNMYIEGQLGTVSFEGGSGMRSQVRLGVDTPYGMPFVQLTHRDFGALSDTAAYVGLEVSGLALKTADYTFSTELLTKAGHHSVNGSVGVIEGSAKLSFSHGLSVDTELSFGSNTSSKLSLNVAFEQ